MTRSVIKTRIRHDLGVSDTDVFSDANLHTLIDEAALDLAKRGKALIIGSSTWSAVASTQRYVISGESAQVSNFLEIYWPAGGVVYTQSSGNTKTAPKDFQFVSESWLDLRIPGWQDASASDTLNKVFLSYDSSGNLTLGVYPKSSTTTPTFKLWYISRGTNMTDDTHYPWTGSTTLLTHLEPYMKLIPFYCLWQLHALKTFNEKAEIKYRDLYLAGAAEMAISQDAVFAANIEGLRAEAMVAPGETFGSN